MTSSGSYIQLNYVENRKKELSIIFLSLSRKCTIFFISSIVCVAFFFSSLLGLKPHTLPSSGSSPKLMSYCQLSSDPFPFLSYMTTEGGHVLALSVDSDFVADRILVWSIFELPTEKLAQFLTYSRWVVNVCLMSELIFRLLGNKHAEF